jgi:single-strand DNA-binding protein
MAVNKVILVGNVGKDPEVRYVESNVAVANFPLATSERGYTSRSGAQVPERTEWHNIVLWRGLAEVAEKYVKKGTQLYIEGKLRTRSWTDNNNVVRYTTEIYADNMEILSRRDTNNSQQVQEQPTIATPEESESDVLPF